MRNCINLSFSFMTFVIKENVDRLGFANQVFDLEGYDYVLNSDNIFTEGNLVKTQFEKLQFILKFFEQIDPLLLEHLHFINREDKLPLHYAMESRNSRMVNLLIYYMAKINYSAMVHFKDLLPQLLAYTNFEKYLLCAPFQTR